MRFRLIVFDWDGTLMDSEARILDSMAAALRDLDLPLLDPQRVRDIIGLGLAESMQALFPESSERLREQVALRYRHHYLGASPIPTPLFPGAREVVEGLVQQGYLLGVATGKGRRGLDQAMRDSGLAPCFHATRCADETFSKPHPAMLQELMEELGARPAETLMVGDTEYDMLLAQNAGASALAVSYGVHGRERLLRHRPLGCVDRVSAIPAWIAGLGLVGHGVLDPSP